MDVEPKEVIQVPLDRSKVQALTVFLFKMRTGNSNSTISAVLGINRVQTISDYAHSVLKAFETDILPYHFGLNTINRESLISSHTTQIAKTLFQKHENLLLISRIAQIDNVSILHLTFLVKNELKMY